MSFDILIVDDEDGVRDSMDEFIRMAGFNSIIASDAEEALALLKKISSDIQVVITDIMLPGMSGLDVLKQIRAMSDIPTIMLTAKGDDVDRILGLELGADDYLAKPFNPRELLARLKAILRRAPAAAATAGRLVVGGIELDAKAHKVTAGSESVRLTGTEFELLRCLAESRGVIVSKDELSKKALGRRYMPYDRSIDTHVSNVRRKLNDAGVSSPSIQSRRGVGYCLLVDE